MAGSRSPAGQGLAAAPVDQAPIAGDARHLLAVSRSLHPGRSWGAFAQTIYSAAFALGLSAVLFWGLWQRLTSFFVDVAGPYQVFWGASAVALVMLVALRYCTLQGFVSYSEADCLFLLSAPVSREDLIRPRLRRITVAVAIVGAIAGLLAGVASGGLAAGAGRLLEGTVAGAALGAAIVAAGWHVQRLPRLSTWVMRLTLPALGLVALLVVADRYGGAAHLAALWSGPWGWGLLPLGASGWASGVVGMALLCVLAGVGWLSVRGTAGKASLESFLSRAQTRSQVTAAAYALDARTIIVASRQPWSQRWRARLRFRPPRRPLLAVPWHGSLVLLRSPLRLAWAVTLAAAAPLLLGAQPGRTGASWAAAVALYLSATSLAEPLRLEVDQTAASTILLPWSLGKTLCLHCVAPVAVVLGTGLVATLIGWAAGLVDGAAVPAIVILAIPLTLVAVISAALSARRGGRLPEHLLFVGAGDTTGFSAFMLVGWIFGWAIEGIVVVALTAGALRASVPLVGAAAVALGVMVWALILGSMLLRSKR